MKDAIGVDMWKCPKCATHRHQFQSTCPCGYLRTPASEKFGWEWNPKDAQKSSTGSLRFNKGKPPVHLVPPSAITAMAKVLGYGAEKYAERNWELGANYSVPYSSMMRHLLAWWDGEENDPESGLPHTYHILMNAAMLVEYEQTLGEEFDDRPDKDRKK